MSLDPRSSEGLQALARLACLELEAKAGPALQAHLGQVLAWVDALRDFEPRADLPVTPLRLGLRADASEPCLSQDEATGNASARDALGFCAPPSGGES